MVRRSRCCNPAPLPSAVQHRQACVLCAVVSSGTQQAAGGVSSWRSSWLSACQWPPSNLSRASTGVRAPVAIPQGQDEAIRCACWPAALHWLSHSRNHLRCGAALEPCEVLAAGTEVLVPPVIQQRSVKQARHQPAPAQAERYRAASHSLLVRNMTWPAGRQLLRRGI